MKRIILAFLIVLIGAILIFSTFGVIKNTEEKVSKKLPKKMMVLIKAPSESQITELSAIFRKYKLSLDIVDRWSGGSIIVVNEKQYSLIKKLGYVSQILCVDLHKSFLEAIKSKEKPGDWGEYHTHEETIEILDWFHRWNPEIVSEPLIIGYSWEGRPIYAIKISDNPNIDEEDEAEILYIARQHAREPMSTEVLIYYMNYLLDGYISNPFVNFLVTNREMWFIPMVNPDGVVYIEQTGDDMWRKNRRPSYGVDLNRNYGDGAMWGYDDTGSSSSPLELIYRGPEPFSELETQAIVNFCNSHDFSILIDWHGGTDQVFTPYGVFR